MNSVVEKIIHRAVENDKHILLPEASDPRVLLATEQILAKNYARITLLGDPATIQAEAVKCGANLEGAMIVNPADDAQRDAYIDKLHQKRQHKGLTRDQAAAYIDQPVFYAAFLLDDGRADGMIAGSLCPTADTVRAALYSVGTAKGCRTVSSCMIMNTINPDVGVDGTLLFADISVLPEPTVDQLADIGIAAGDATKALMNVEPTIAMLSFSTKGSAHSPAVQKVIDATAKIKERRPDLHVDGEMQLDAAIIPSIGKKKAPDSPVAGKATTIVFPDLSSGNIGYKLVERLGNATALGPIMLGLAKPINDLSRGCSVEDIVLLTAITAVQDL